MKHSAGFNQRLLLMVWAQTAMHFSANLEQYGNAGGLTAFFPVGQKSQRHIFFLWGKMKFGLCQTEVHRIL